MLSAIMSAIFAVGGFLSVVRGLDAEHKAAFEAIATCAYDTWDAGVSDMRKKGGHPDSSQKLEEACIIMRVRLRHCYK